MSTQLETAMKFVPIALLALATGCAPMKADELRERGNLIEYTSKLPPQAAAECIAKNGSLYAEAFAVPHPTRPLEVLIYAPMAAGTVVVTVLHAIATVNPDGSGSRVEIRYQPMLVAESPRALGPRPEVQSRTHHGEFNRYVRRLPDGC